jgi:hypothetical protein
MHNRQPPGRNTSKRQFLTAFAAFGACAALPAWQTPAASPKPLLIDVHHHVFPPAFLAAGLETYIPLNRARAFTKQGECREKNNRGRGVRSNRALSGSEWSD